MPESLLYHRESVCLTLCVGAGAPLRLLVKFGQVTVKAPRTTPSLRTGNAKQEVAVTDVRRWKDRENASLCLRERACEGFPSKNPIFKTSVGFAFNREHAAQCVLRTLGTFSPDARRLSRWEVHFFYPRMD